MQADSALTNPDVLLAMDASTAALEVRAGRTTATALVEACLARIGQRESDARAWAFLDPECALAQAAELDRKSAPAGPLHGVSVGIKDVLLTRDMPTQYNSPIYRGHQSVEDSAAVALLRQAGAVILGKTETVEFASIGAVPETRNPHNLQHTPGGSSSGSAAAVADRHVHLAIGTQTGGSIIRPASFCGVWALKPTWGTVCTEGCKQSAPDLDTIGWFGSSAADLRLLLDVFSPVAEPRTPAPPLRGTRIAVWRTPAWDAAEQATRSALDHAIARLRASDAQVSEFPEDPAFGGLIEAQKIVMFKQGQRSFLREFRAAPDQLHPAIAELVRTGGGYSDSDLAGALALASRARKRFDELAADFDAVLAPSTPGEAPFGLASTGNYVFNGLFTLLHVPCVNMPLWHAANGLPVGLTVTGPRNSDRSIVALAEAIDNPVRNIHWGNRHWIDDRP